MKKKTPPFFLLGLSLLILACTQSGNLVIRHQKTGPIETNCYLIYDDVSREAALIDVGGPIDTLVGYIEENDLTLKYIFSTHGHMDHIEGVPAMKKRFPDARFGCNRQDFTTFLGSVKWVEANWDPQVLAAMKQNPDIARWFDYDLLTFPEPDIDLKDNQIYRLGNLEIRTLLSPGHSAGSICFHTGNALFSGDVLFHRQVGRTDLLDGSNEAIVQSVRRLYDELPDATVVYPGHGPFTYIGTEKTENEEVTENTVHL
jgi:glyoxylase-like metal-dependent hydrolase (beta-lactamase superfamily II)